MRRKAIRLFPNNQRVATYRNDNLDLEVAIPYNPETLGKRLLSTVGNFTESLDEAMSPELKKIRTDRRTLERDVETTRKAMTKTKQKADITAADPKAYPRNLAAHIKAANKHQLSVKTLQHHIKQHGENLDTLTEGFDDIPRQRKIDVIQAAYKRLVGEGNKGELDIALYNWLGSELEENGDDVSDWNDDIIDDVYEDYMALIGVNEDTSDNLFGMYVKHLQSPRNLKDPSFRPHRHIEKVVRQRYGEKALNHFKSAAGHHIEGDEGRANHHYAKYKHAAAELGEDVVHEATIHTLHAITKTRHPAQVRYKNGSSGMVDHPTAAMIMKLHSKVNPQNKKKIESLINSGPAGLSKVAKFVSTHLK
jgi:hypothetical protein